MNGLLLESEENLTSSGMGEIILFISSAVSLLHGEEQDADETEESSVNWSSPDTLEVGDCKLGAIFNGNLNSRICFEYINCRKVYVSRG